MLVPKPQPTLTQYVLESLSPRSRRKTPKYFERKSLLLLCYFHPILVPLNVEILLDIEKKKRIKETRW